jgi:hypothetical protein
MGAVAPLDGDLLERLPQARLLLVRERGPEDRPARASPPCLYPLQGGRDLILITLSYARVVVDSGMSGPGGTCDTARWGLAVGEADRGVWRTRGTEGVQAVVVKDASAIGVREPAASYVESRPPQESRPLIPDDKGRLLLRLGM